MRLLSEGALHVPIAGAQLPDPNLVLAGLVTIRENGFMLVIPDTEVAQQSVEALEPSDPGEGPLLYKGIVDLANTRGKKVGPAMVILVDLPWSYASCIYNSVQFRGSAAQQFKVLGFATEEGAVGKPLRTAVRDLSTLWIGEMDAEAAQEYISAAEGPFESGHDGNPLEPEEMDTVAALQQRVVQLEQELRHRPAVAQAPLPIIPEMPSTTSAVGESFQPSSGRFWRGTPGPHLTPGEWDKIKALVGATRPRVASAEQRRPHVPPQLQAQEALFADVEREAIEEDFGLAVDPLQNVALTASQDPMQSVLLASLQQNQLLLQKLVGGRSSDPVLRALGGGGSDSGSGSSSSGVRGCLARGVFIKASRDLNVVAETVRISALRELGLTQDREDSNLLT